MYAVAQLVCRKYNGFDRELLAAYKAVRQFRYFLEDRIFTSRVENLPFTMQLYQEKTHLSPRQYRHLLYISL